MSESWKDLYLKQKFFLTYIRSSFLRIQTSVNSNMLFIYKSCMKQHWTHTKVMCEYSSQFFVHFQHSRRDILLTILLLLFPCPSKLYLTPFMFFINVKVKWLGQGYRMNSTIWLNRVTHIHCSHYHVFHERLHGQWSVNALPPSCGCLVILHKHLHAIKTDNPHFV